MLRANAKLKKFSVLYKTHPSLPPVRVEMVDFTKSGAALRLPQGAQVLEMVEITPESNQEKESAEDGRK